jgi:hypothetical protein
MIPTLVGSVLPSVVNTIAGKGIVGQFLGAGLDTIVRNLNTKSTMVNNIRQQYMDKQDYEYEPPIMKKRKIKAYEAE